MPDKTKAKKKMGQEATPPKQAKAPKPKDGLALRKFTLLRLVTWITDIVKNPDLPEQTVKPLFLHGSQARSRNKIRQIIVDRAKAVEQERLDLVERHVKKDKDGKELMDESGENYQMEDREAFDKEFMALMEEITIFDILPSNRADWLVVRDIVLNSTTDIPAGAEATIYEEVCAALEAM